MNTPAVLSAPSSFMGLCQATINLQHVDFWLQKIKPRWSLQLPLVEVVAREQASANSVILWLKPNRHVADFCAGQHLTVYVEVNGRRVARSYSPSRLQGRAGLLAITVKQVDGGVASTWLCQQAKIGDVLEVGAPFGDMTLQHAAARPLLLLAAGSGITPMISLVREALASAAPQQKIQLMYWVKTAAEACFVAELQQLADQHAHFSVQVLYTQGQHAQGRLSAAQIAAAVGDLSAYQVYACGGADFVQQAEQVCKATSAGFFAEAFSLPTLASNSSGQTITVTLSKQQRQVQILAGQAILPALEAQGIQPNFGCRMGICNKCACAKSSGSTRHLLAGQVENEPSSALRICVNAAQNDITLDL